MTVINAQGSDQGVNISLFSDQFNFDEQDDDGINSATAYSWITSGDDDVQARGTNMDFTDPTPDTGNVNEIDFDLSNDADVDVTIRNITGVTGTGGITTARLGVIVDGLQDFADEILSFDDDFTGSSFNDIIKTFGGDDNIVMGLGNDSADGGDNNDSILGEDGNDTLSGGAGNDTLDGGDDADTLNGGSGVDSMNGGLGNDVYTVDVTADIAAESAGGVDLVNAGDDYTLSVNLENLTLTGSADTNGHGNNSRANVITGNSGDNLLRGLALNDTITGGSGGNDTLDGGTGADSMTGNVGNTVYIVDNAGDSASEVAGGTDRVEASVTWSLVPSVNIENLTLTGSGNINGQGNNSRANVIIGNSGANDLQGLALNDTLTGGGGNDTLNGGTGNDSMNGQAGNDLYLVNTTGDTSQEDVDTAAGGVDLVQNTATHTLGFGVENMQMFGAANIDGTGNALGNSMAGNAGANVLEGLGGRDVLNGGGDDDVLIGGAGRDTQSGGAGDDDFVFNAASESGPAATQRDTINGFDVPGPGAGDTIDLSGVDADTSDAADTAFDFLGDIQNPFPADVDPASLYLRNVGADTLVCLNVDADIAIEMSILIVDGATTAADYTSQDFSL